jgi:hypothetical protein
MMKIIMESTTPTGKTIIKTSMVEPNSMLKSDDHQLYYIGGKAVLVCPNLNKIGALWQSYRKIGENDQGEYISCECGKHIPIIL